MKIVNMEIPDEMVSYAVPESAEDIKKRNAMMLYPYVHDEMISYGRAAEILGMFKMDLITLYGKLGLPYMEMTDDELEEELAAVRYLGEILP